MSNQKEYVKEGGVMLLPLRCIHFLQENEKLAREAGEAIIMKKPQFMTVEFLKQFQVAGTEDDLKFFVQVINKREMIDTSGLPLEELHEQLDKLGVETLKTELVC